MEEKVLFTKALYELLFSEERTTSLEPREILPGINKLLEYYEKVNNIILPRFDLEDPDPHYVYNKITDIIINN
jgi:hypothetical protein